MSSLVLAGIFHKLGVRLLAVLNCEAVSVSSNNCTWNYDHLEERDRFINSDGDFLLLLPYLLGPRPTKSR